MIKETEIYNGEDSVFNKWCWKSWTAPCKTTTLELSLIPYTKIKKWFKDQFKDLNIRYDIIKLLEENTSKTFSDINYSNIFLAKSPKEKEIKAKMNK